MKLRDLSVLVDTLPGDAGEGVFQIENNNKGQ